MKGTFRMRSSARGRHGNMPRISRPQSRGGCLIAAAIGAVFLLLAVINLPSTVAFIRFLCLCLPYIVVGGIGVFTFFRARRNDNWLVATGVIAIYCVIWVWGTLAGGSLVAMYRDLNPSVISKVEDTRVFRYTPSIVAQNRSHSSNLTSDLARGEVDPFVGKDGITRWILPLKPSGLVNEIWPSKKGQFVLIDTDNQLKPFSSPFNYVEGGWLGNGFDWQAAWRAPLSEVSNDIYYVQAPGSTEQQLAAVAPLTSYRLSLWFGVFPVWTETWGGDVIFMPDGRVITAGPAEAQALLPGERLVPESYARRVAEAYGYRNGLWGRMVLNQGVTEIPLLEDNQMPFLVGGDWQTVVEPSGSDRKNVNAVIFTDNQTGLTTVQEVNGTQALSGPNAIIALMQGKIPNGQWGTTNALIEPISIYHDGVLWYLATTTNNANRVEVANTVAMSADGGHIVWMASPQEVQGFLNNTFAGRPVDTFFSSTSPGGAQPTTPATGGGVCTVEDMSGCSNSQLVDIIQRASERLRTGR